MHSPSHKDFSCILNILDSIKKIQDYSGKFKNADEFYRDNMSFDASMMNFIVISEMADKISEELISDTAAQINWLKVKGFRNIVAHNYFGIDAEEVWQIIGNSLPKLKQDLESIIE